jgi:hypothetical protein
VTTVTAPRRLLDRPAVREFALTAGLFAAWQLVVQVTLTRSAGAMRAGHWLWALERIARLPNEAAVQRLALEHRWLLAVVTDFYNLAHFPAMIAVLVWAYRRDRARYVALRRLVVAVTAAWLLIVAAVPSAPPRLFHPDGLVDTAQLLGRSEYATSHVDVYSTFPSLHVAWAVLVAIAVLTFGATRLRWAALGYPLATVLAVVVTGNHTWIDCAAAAALVAACYALTPDVATALRGPQRAHR